MGMDRQFPQYRSFVAVEEYGKTTQKIIKSDFSTTAEAWTWISNTFEGDDIQICGIYEDDELRRKCYLSENL